MNLAKRIRDCRYAKGWGPDELASRAEISRTALYQIECGKTETPRAGTLRRIARALEISIETLLGNEDHGALAFAATPAVAVQTRIAEPARIMNGRIAGLHDDEVDADVDSPWAMNGHIDDWSSLQRRDLVRKFHEVLGTPLGDAIARLVEESYRLVPVRRAK